MTVPEVLCVGVATVDTIAVVDRIPGRDERVVADPFVNGGGGPAATAAVTLARLGIPVAFCGVVGNDAAGRLVRDSLDREGVDTAWLRTDDEGRTAQSMILIDRESAARTIITTPPPRIDPGDVPATGIPWVHVDHGGFAAAWESVTAGGSLLSVDGGNPIPGLRFDGLELYAPTTAAVRGLFPGADLDESMRAAAAAGAREVVATAGVQGSYVLSDGEIVHIAPFAIEAVSTMGAGDVFHGALLAARVEGRSLVEAATWASAVAALSCRALDGRTAIPDRRETEDYLAVRTAEQRA